VHDAVAIALEWGAQRVVGFRVRPPPAALGVARKGREHPAGAAVDAEAAV
jgi:hypothetical protein